MPKQSKNQNNHNNQNFAIAALHVDHSGSVAVRLLQNSDYFDSSEYFEVSQNFDSSVLFAF